MRTAARAVKSASGEKDQTELIGKTISKTVRIGPMEKGLRRFSVPDLLVACCLLKPLTASEQYSNKTGLYHICEFLNSLKEMTGYFLKILQLVRFEQMHEPDRQITILFLSWRDPVPGQFTIGPVIDACLFAHGLPANAILAVFTDASFEGHQHFSADHTSFLFFAHGDDSIPLATPLPSF